MLSAKVKNRDSLRRWRLLVAAVFLFFLSACSFLSQGKVELSAEYLKHFSAGEAAWEARDYVAAATAYNQAHLLAPANGQLAFRLGYVYEKIEKYADAGNVYREALKVVDLPLELQQKLTYRLALLEAFRFNSRAAVTQLLATLPASSLYAADLRAVQSILLGDGRTALEELNSARTLPLTQEESSIILYHAARAYHLTGDRDRALQNLYEAINRAERSPISHDISEFRDLLLTQPRS